LIHRANLENNAELHKFAELLEREVIGAVEEGIMSKDLTMLVLILASNLFLFYFKFCFP
jgi:hypothetical protein